MPAVLNRLDCVKAGQAAAAHPLQRTHALTVHQCQDWTNARRGRRGRGWLLRRRRRRQVTHPCSAHEHGWETRHVTSTVS